MRPVHVCRSSADCWTPASCSPHSLGVSHLANVFVRTLQHQQRELGITARDVSCVTIAGTW